MLKDLVREAKLSIRAVLILFSLRRPILIFQFGKVGSTTICRTLDKNNRSSLHMHELTDNREVRAVADLIRAKVPGWKVITLVRDPVAREVSYFFQNLDSETTTPYVGTRSYVLSLSRERLGQLFVEKMCDLKEHPFEWFNRFIRPSFGLDVFLEPFDKERGFQIYKTSIADILLIRYENLWNEGKKAIADFVHLKQLEWTPNNISSDKYYAKQYKTFKEEFIMPKKYIEEIYKSPYVEKFYTTDEIEIFKQAWRTK